MPQPIPDIDMSEPDQRVELLWRALSRAIDPELGIDVVALRLEYGVEVHYDVEHISHTLTPRGCPRQRYITDAIRAAALEVEGICGVETHIVWEPAWHPGLIAANAW